MITEDYCSYEVAKLLKEKGFSENTICKYADVEGVIEKWYDDYRERVLRFDWEEGHLIEPLIEPKDQYEIIGDTISAPTHQMAMKWLREAHSIVITIDLRKVNQGKGWGYIAVIHTLEKDFDTELLYADYAHCIDEAIKYTLENLI